MPALLLFLALLLQPAPPHDLTAFWDSENSATVSWQQEARGCLYRNTTFIGCWEGVGRVVVQFGHVGPLDYSARPQAGDVYVLVTNEQSYRAPLRAREVYLAVWMG